MWRGEAGERALPKRRSPGSPPLQHQSERTEVSASDDSRSWPFRSLPWGRRALNPGNCKTNQKAASPLPRTWAQVGKCGSGSRPWIFCLEAADVFSQLMRLTKNILWGFMKFLALKGFLVFKKVGNSRIAHRNTQAWSPTVPHSKILSFIVINQVALLYNTCKIKKMISSKPRHYIM